MWYFLWGGGWSWVFKDDAAFLVAAGTRGGGEPRDSFNTDENEKDSIVPVGGVDMFHTQVKHKKQTLCLTKIRIRLWLWEVLTCLTQGTNTKDNHSV